MRGSNHGKVMTQHVNLFIKKLLGSLKTSNFCFLTFLYHVTKKPQMFHLHSYDIHPLISLIRSTYRSSAHFFGASFFPNRFRLFFLLILIVFNFKKFIFLESRHIPTHQEVYTLQSDNCVISSTSSAKTYSLTERTKPVFV